MKSILSFFIVIISLLLMGLQNTYAQNVTINVPVANLINKSEFTTQATVMNTQGSTNWRAGAINPTIRSNGSDWFRHRTAGNPSLPSEVLQWQLASIGGEPAPFKKGSDTLPVYKWFTTGDQTWYQIRTTRGDHPGGNIVFNFKMPSELLSSNTFNAGNYSMPVTHNYGRSGWFAIEFTPEYFDVIVSIPEDITWISNNLSQYITVSSLDEYRTSSKEFVLDFGLSEVFSTLNYNLWAKAASADIQFTSSKGASSSRDLSLIRLSSTNAKISSSKLTSNFQNLNTNSRFIVEKGNRNSFKLEGKISAADLKNYFFEAGTYQFQLNLNAQGMENGRSALQNTDVVLKVPSLSEIIIPTNLEEINFEFNSAEQYEQGDAKVIPNQIRLSNNENYELYVKSVNPFFTINGTQTDVPSSTLQVSIKGAGIKQSLSTSPQKLLQNGTPVLDKNLDMEYSISPKSAKGLVGKAKNTYSINVVYSFTAT